MLEDTIIAVSTPPGTGGLGIVRLSGGDALRVARGLFRAKTGRRRGLPARRLVLGSIVDARSGGVIDECFLTYFKAPHSYTREDVVELSCHGSPVVLDEIVRLGVQAGARMAHPGEFTLRAFANGRLDIMQAEAVNDLIRAVTLTQAHVSLRQLSGSLSRRIARLRKSLIHLAGQVEAGIEFPEERLRPTAARHARALAAAASDVESLVATYGTGRAMKEGVLLAIVGRTNVGKSTLFNALLEEDRAIVTPYPGTTRDYLREEIIIRDFVFHIVDMAGLGRPSHPVEREGIAKGGRIARGADGLLIVLDGSRRASPEDLRLLKRFTGKKAIVVVNKSDLPLKMDLHGLKTPASETSAIQVSALKGTNVTRLREEIYRAFVPAGSFQEDVILHARQRDLLIGILTSLSEAKKFLDAGHSEELCAEELRRALLLVGRLTGEIKAEDIMTDIFSRFCVGK